MTEFFQKLRHALDEAYPDRHVQIHLRAMWSTYDTRYYAMDCEQLAKLGLVDTIISYPQRYREIISPEFYRDGKIDLEDYSRFVYGRNERPFIRDYDNSTCVAPYPDSNGVPQGPESYAQCVNQWMELERKYGVKIYMDIITKENRNRLRTE